jgi:hypothetical protein
MDIVHTLLFKYKKEFTDEKLYEKFGVYCYNNLTLKELI